MHFVNRSNSLARLAMLAAVALVGGPSSPALQALEQVRQFAPPPAPSWRRGKGKGRQSHRPSGVAVAKRQARKRRNVRARSAK